MHATCRRFMTPFRMTFSRTCRKRARWKSIWTRFIVLPSLGKLWDFALWVLHMAFEVIAATNVRGARVIYAGRRLLHPPPLGFGENCVIVKTLLLITWSLGIRPTLRIHRNESRDGEWIVGAHYCSSAATSRAHTHSQTLWNLLHSFNRCRAVVVFRSIHEITRRSNNRSWWWVLRPRGDGRVKTLFSCIWVGKASVWMWNFQESKFNRMKLCRSFLSQAEFSFLSSFFGSHGWVDLISLKS